MVVVVFVCCIQQWYQSLATSRGGYWVNDVDPLITLEEMKVAAIRR